MNDAPAFLCLDARPDWHGREEAPPIPVELPTRWIRFDMEWVDGYSPVPVFIGTVRLLDEHDTDAHLFGVRYELDQSKLDDERMRGGHFVHFVVVETTDRESRRHWLAQHDVVYSTGSDAGVTMKDAKKVNAKQHSLDAPPQWKAYDAHWPVFDDAPMQFVGQFHLFENDVSRVHLTWNENVYLFCTSHASGGTFAISTQAAKYQSAEEHYAEEAARARRRR